MKFSTKLIICFCLLTIGLVAVGGLYLYYNSSVNNRVLEENRETNRQLEYSGDLGLNLYRSLYNSGALLEDLQRSGAADSLQLNRPHSRENITGLLNESNRYLDRVAALADTGATSNVGDSVAVKLDRLKEKMEIYESLVGQLFSLSTESRRDAEEFYTVTIEPYFRSNVIPAFEHIRQEIRTVHDREVRRLNSRIETARTALAAAAVVILLFTIGLVYYLYESFASPLRRLTRAVKRIGEGDFRHKIEISSQDELGQLAGEFNRMVDRLNESTVSRNYMDNIINSMGDALIVTDRQYRIVKTNSATHAMLDYTEEELVGEPLSMVFEDDSEVDGIDGDLFRGMTESHETVCVTSEGRTVPVSLSRAALFDNDGNREGMVFLASDITRRKRAENQIRKSLKEKEVLLTEIHHRVKNNLAVISGILQMQIWESDHEEVAAALRDSQLRVQSIALVHEKLYQTENLSHIKFDEYVQDLLRAITDSYDGIGKDITVETDLEPVVLTINQAIPCSLMLNELVANAYKHAFGDEGQKGKIRILLAEEGKQVRLAIRDNGRGVADKFADNSSESVGGSLVETLVRQLEGGMEVESGDGSSFVITFERESVS